MTGGCGGLRNPDGTFLTNQYDARGWLTNIADGATGGSVVRYQYNAAGYRTKRIVGNTNTITEYGYDAAGRLTGLTNKAVSGGTLWTVSTYTYGYDNSGNRRWVKRLSNLGDVYTYDPADQVTNVIYPERTVQFAYDILDRLKILL